MSCRTITELQKIRSILVHSLQEVDNLIRVLEEVRKPLPPREPLIVIDYGTEKE